MKGKYFKKLSTLTLIFTLYGQSFVSSFSLFGMILPSAEAALTLDPSQLTQYRLLNQYFNKPAHSNPVPYFDFSIDDPTGGPTNDPHTGEYLGPWVNAEPEGTPPRWINPNGVLALESELLRELSINLSTDLSSLVFGDTAVPSDVLDAYLDQAEGIREVKLRDADGQVVYEPRSGPLQPHQREDERYIPVKVVDIFQESELARFFRYAAYATDHTALKVMIANGKYAQENLTDQISFLVGQRPLIRKKVHEMAMAIHQFKIEMGGLEIKEAELKKMVEGAMRKKLPEPFREDAEKFERSVGRVTTSLLGDIKGFASAEMGGSQIWRGTKALVSFVSDVGGYAYNAVTGTSDAIENRQKAGESALEQLIQKRVALSLSLERYNEFIQTLEDDKRNLGVVTNALERAWEITDKLSFHQPSGIPVVDALAQKRKSLFFHLMAKNPIFARHPEFFLPENVRKRDTYFIRYFQLNMFFDPDNPGGFSGTIMNRKATELEKKLKELHQDLKRNLDDLVDDHQLRDEMIDADPKTARLKRIQLNWTIATSALAFVIFGLRVNQTIHNERDDEGDKGTQTEDELVQYTGLVRELTGIFSTIINVAVSRKILEMGEQAQADRREKEKMEAEIAKIKKSMSELMTIFEERRNPIELSALFLFDHWHKLYKVEDYFEIMDGPLPPRDPSQGASAAADVGPLTAPKPSRASQLAALKRDISEEGLRSNPARFIKALDFWIDSDEYAIMRFHSSFDKETEDADMFYDFFHKFEGLFRKHMGESYLDGSVTSTYRKTGRMDTWYFEDERCDALFQPEGLHDLFKHFNLFSRTRGHLQHHLKLGTGADTEKSIDLESILERFRTYVQQYARELVATTERVPRPAPLPIMAPPAPPAAPPAPPAPPLPPPPPGVYVGAPAQFPGRQAAPLPLKRSKSRPQDHVAHRVGEGRELLPMASERAGPAVIEVEGDGPREALKAAAEAVLKMPEPSSRRGRRGGGAAAASESSVRLPSDLL